VSVGCYASNSFTSYIDIFSETLSAAHCDSACIDFPVSCTSYVINSFVYYGVYSNTSMTVEMCLQICTTIGFKYAGLNGWKIYLLRRNK